MLHTILRAGASGLLALAALSAHADILVGEFRGVNAGDIGPLLRFGPQQDGDQAPLATLTTNSPGDTLRTPLYATYEPVEDVVYVSDYWGRAIRVYPVGASGNVGSLRTITSAQLGQPRATAIDAAHDELFAIVSNCCVATFARTANGTPAPRRQISWGGSSGPSRLNNPSDIQYLRATDELVVADYRQLQNGSTGVLLFFTRTASGDAAPVRVIEGAATRLGGSVAGVAYAAAHGELIALVVDGDAYRIVTFAEAASGNAVPTRVIEGPNLRIENPGAIAYDPETDFVYVASGTNGSPNPALLAFPRTANGDVAPARVIAGPHTGIVDPGAVVAVPAGDVVFRNGFE